MTSFKTVKIRVAYQDLGLIDYKEAWDYQEKLFGRIMDRKILNRKENRDEDQPGENHLLLCEHPHVFTLGKNGKEENILVDRSKLNNGEISFYKINRGGDITYHGPGQIVGYPILDLEQFGMSIREYIYRLEEVIIQTLNHFGIRGARFAGATGIWIDPDDQQNEKKICAIGVRASRYITMHGFALNVDTDLNYFNMINPCGFTNKGVVSMESLLGKAPDVDDVKNELKAKFLDIFEAEWIKNGS